MNGELLRLIDAIHRDKDIDREVIFQGIESALTTAAKKRLGTDEILVDLVRPPRHPKGLKLQSVVALIGRPILFQRSTVVGMMLQCEWPITTFQSVES